MPTCFVVMGFGKKTDYPTGRVLDLDKSYKYIIKPAVQAAGYQCERADEIPHSGNINVPMYQRLLNADVVIADVSTYNPNAFYELGVRHALKPYTTILIAEDKLVFPFDVGQIAIRTYHHLGEGIDFGEVERMREELQKAIQTIGSQSACDSPVYTFIKDLRPPSVAQPEMDGGAMSFETVFFSDAEEPAQPSVRSLMDEAEDALERKDYVTARDRLTEVRRLMPNDPFVVQTLALATWEAGLPTELDALHEACKLVESLGPDGTTDTETLSLWGAVHARLWEMEHSPADLEQAIRAHEKAFQVRHDFENGLRLAFLMNARAALRANDNPAEAIADFVLAQRTRRSVIEQCERLLRAEPAPNAPEEYRLRAALAEAYAGIGEAAQSEAMLAAARHLDAGGADACAAQIAQLQAMTADSPLRRIV